MKQIDLPTAAGRLRRFLATALGAAAALCAAVPPAFAAATVNKGDTSWMLVATILVILMTIPGLALFYGGLVRSKNVLSVFMQVFMCFCLISILWVAYGYSLAFSGNGSAALTPFIGGFSKAMLAGVDINTMAATFSKEIFIPEFVYVIVPDDLCLHHPGAHCRCLRRAHEVFRRAAVHRPVVHLRLSADRPHGVVLGRPRRLHAEPGQLPYLNGILGESTAAKFLADYTAAATDQAKADVLSALGSAIGATNGYLFNLGALDFAGGTVVHINAGVAGLVCALVLGPRVGFGKRADGAAQSRPHLHRRLPAVGRLVSASTPAPTSRPTG